eukprot:SAG11_NODE_487_length_8999_cov_16.256966_1_plen_57_part_00
MVSSYINIEYISGRKKEEENKGGLLRKKYGQDPKFNLVGQRSEDRVHRGRGRPLLH